MRTAGAGTEKRMPNDTVLAGMPKHLHRNAAVDIAADRLGSRKTIDEPFEKGYY